MASLQAASRSTDLQPSSPRISFSADFLDDDSNFISISPNPQAERDLQIERAKNAADFEFLSSKGNMSMLSAEELFCEGKLLPFWQVHQCGKLDNISLKSKASDRDEEKQEEKKKEEEEEEEGTRVSWFVDNDPSPRLPKCTVLWKELLKLRKQRASSLSPSSSSSSTSSSSSSLSDTVTAQEGKSGCGNKEKHVGKRMKKGKLEGTRSATVRIRPIINVPICTQVKSSALPPLFPLKKGR